MVSHVCRSQIHHCYHSSGDIQMSLSLSLDCAPWLGNFRNLPDCKSLLLELQNHSIILQEFWGLNPGVLTCSVSLLSISPALEHYLLLICVYRGLILSFTVPAYITCLSVRKCIKHILKYSILMWCWNLLVLTASEHQRSSWICTWFKLHPFHLLEEIPSCMNYKAWFHTGILKWCSEVILQLTDICHEKYIQSLGILE